MAVPVYKRNLSKKQYFYYFKKIQKEVISLLLRDFNISEEKREDTPDWLINQKRIEIMRSLSIISTCISRAEAFYPTTEKIKNDVLLYQIRAIQECYNLHDNIQFCSEIFFIKKIKIYNEIAYSIQQEVVFLKEWKKIVNKIQIQKQ